MAVLTARRRRRRRARRRRCAVLLLAALVLAAVWGLGRGAQTLIAGRGGPPYVVAVDAGHGGSDTGALGVVQESDMTAATAQALTELLAADDRFRPVATREDYNTTATPRERAQTANRRHADLLLSLHGNADSSPDTAGFECYPVTPGRRRHTDSLRFAQLLAAEMENAGAHLRAGNGIRYAYYDNDSKILVDSSDDAVRSEPTFGVLEDADCPAVLAEQCFVTCPADVDAFGDADGCALTAGCYYRAICAYFGVEPQA